MRMAVETIDAGCLMVMTHTLISIMIVFLLAQKKTKLIPNAENKYRTDALWLRNLNLSFFYREKKRQSLWKSEDISTSATGSNLASTLESPIHIFTYTLVSIMVWFLCRHTYTYWYIHTWSITHATWCPYIPPLEACVNISTAVSWLLCQFYFCYHHCCSDHET